MLAIYPPQNQTHFCADHQAHAGVCRAVAVALTMHNSLQATEASCLQSCCWQHVAAKPRQHARLPLQHSSSNRPQPRRRWQLARLSSVLQHGCRLSGFASSFCTGIRARSGAGCGTIDSALLCWQLRGAPGGGPCCAALPALCGSLGRTSDALPILMPRAALSSTIIPPTHTRLRAWPQHCRQPQPPGSADSMHWQSSVRASAAQRQRMRSSTQRLASSLHGSCAWHASSELPGPGAAGRSSSCSSTGGSTCCCRHHACQVMLGVETCPLPHLHAPAATPRATAASCTGCSSAGGALMAAAQRQRLSASC